MNNLNNNGSGLETQVTLVGYEFEAGSETDAQIHEWLQDPGPVRLYCSDAAACIEALERFEVVPFILPTAPTKKPKRGEKFVEEFVAVFEKDGILYSTIPFAKETQAAAAALWFVAGDKSRLT